MRTTLDLPDETFRRLKAEAALRGFKLKEFVTYLIEHGLEAESSPSVTRRHSSAFPIPIAREADGSVTAALTNARLHAIMETGDLAEFRRVLRSSRPSK